MKHLSVLSQPQETLTKEELKNYKQVWPKKTKLWPCFLGLGLLIFLFFFSKNQTTQTLSDILTPQQFVAAQALIVATATPDDIELLKKALEDFTKTLDLPTRTAIENLAKKGNPEAQILAGFLKKGQVTATKTYFVNATTASTPVGYGLTPEWHTGGTYQLEKRGEGLYVNGKKVVLQLTEKQQKGKSTTGHEVRAEMEGKSLPDPVLDFLLGNQELIPEAWKTAGLIYFWNTGYRNAYGDLYVRYLRWRGGEWRWGDRWLGRDWSDDEPAAVLE